MSTQVTFYPLTEAEIDEYVAMGESRGRAGAYGIEGIGVVLVQSIQGDYPNIVGLPVAEDAPPPGQTAGSVTGTRTGPRRVGYGWGWFHGQRASQVPGTPEKRGGARRSSCWRRPCSPGAPPFPSVGPGPPSRRSSLKRPPGAYVLALVNQAVRRPWPSPGLCDHRTGWGRGAGGGPGGHRGPQRAAPPGAGHAGGKPQRQRHRGGARGQPDRGCPAQRPGLSPCP